MSNQIRTWEQAYADAQHAMEATSPTGRDVSMAGDRCPLMPSEAHCWHDTHGYWHDPFPPPLVCCWCGQETLDMAAVPHQHGPHTPNV